MTGNDDKEYFIHSKRSLNQNRLKSNSDYSYKMWVNEVCYDDMDDLIFAMADTTTDWGFHPEVPAPAAVLFFAL